MTRPKLHEPRTLGRGPLRITPIGFGTAALGDMPASYGYEVGAARARATVEAILDGPANWLDTSRNYGLGRSEERIGEVIKERGGLPEGFVLSTKLDRDNQSNRFDADRARRSLEESLQALGLERIPLLHLHDPEHAASLDEVNGAISALFEMKAEGLTQAVGLAAGRVDIMMPMLREWEFDALITHNRFTLLNRSAEEMMDLALERGTAVLNAAPYASGVLAKGSAASRRYCYQDADEPLLERVRRIEALCAAHEVPLGAAALQFSLRDPRVSATICGVSAPERVQQTIDWAEWPITEELWSALDALPFDEEDPESTRDYKLG